MSFPLSLKILYKILRKLNYKVQGICAPAENHLPFIHETHVLLVKKTLLSFLSIFLSQAAGGVPAFARRHSLDLAKPT
jgi:hypothetical protein